MMQIASQGKYLLNGSSPFSDNTFLILFLPHRYSIVMYPRWNFVYGICVKTNKTLEKWFFYFLFYFCVIRSEEKN